MRAVADGDTGALRLLYDRHAPWISVRLTRRCNDPGLVAEVLQDTFVAVWRGRAATAVTGRWPAGCGVSRSSGWSPACASTVRGPRSSSPTSARASDASAEERVLAGVEYGDVGLALARLSPEMRAVVQATVLDGLTTREAAQLLGVPAEHRQDPAAPGQGAAAPRTDGGMGMTHSGGTWAPRHADPEACARWVDGTAGPLAWRCRSSSTSRRCGRRAGPRSPPRPAAEPWRRVWDEVLAERRGPGQPAGRTAAVSDWAYAVRRPA